LDTLNEIGCLVKLQQLYASNNKLKRISELKDLLIDWRFLWKLDLSNNPVCEKSKYRERIILMAPNLDILDAKDINDMSRQFLKNWKASKTNFQKQPPLDS
jgi:protein phosphatase 1 regulatory subunit 42